MTDTQVNNGVNVEHLLGARDALEEQPAAAQFKWRSSCEWVNGTHSRSTITSFFAMGSFDQVAEGLQVRQVARPVKPCSTGNLPQMRGETVVEAFDDAIPGELRPHESPTRLPHCCGTLRVGQEEIQPIDDVVDRRHHESGLAG